MVFCYIEFSQYITTFLAIFRRFSNTFRRFPKILQTLSEGQTNESEHFRTFSKMTEDDRRLPKKIRICFDHTPTNLSAVKKGRNVIKNDIITCLDKFDISTCGDIATTRHTTNFRLEISLARQTFCRRLISVEGVF